MLFDICIQITQIRAKSSVNHVYIIRMELRRPANVPRRATSVSTVYTRVTLKSYGYSRSCRLYRYGLDAEREDQARSVQKSSEITPTPSNGADTPRQRSRRGLSILILPCAPLLLRRIHARTPTTRSVHMSRPSSKTRGE